LLEHIDGHFVDSLGLNSEYFLVSKPYEVHLISWVHFPQHLGTLQPHSSVSFGQLLHVALLQTLQTKVFVDDAENR